MSLSKESADWLKKPPYDFSESNVHDRVLIVEGQKFHVQSGVLIVWSEFFQGLFLSNFKEKNDDEIEIKDISADHFRMFLQVIYPGEFIITADNVSPLSELACQFLSSEVCKMCQSYVNHNWQKMNLFDALNLAFQLYLEDVKEKIVDQFLADKPVIRYTCDEGNEPLGRCSEHPEEDVQIYLEGYTVNANSLIAKNYDAFQKLSLEAKGYLFEKIVAKNYTKF